MDRTKYNPKSYFGASTKLFEVIKSYQIRSDKLETGRDPWVEFQILPSAKSSFKGTEKKLRLEVGVIIRK